MSYYLYIENLTEKKGQEETTHCIPASHKYNFVSTRTESIFTTFESTDMLFVFLARSFHLKRRASSSMLFSVSVSILVHYYCKAKKTLPLSITTIGSLECMK